MPTYLQSTNIPSTTNDSQNIKITVDVPFTNHEVFDYLHWQSFNTANNYRNACIKKWENMHLLQHTICMGLQIAIFLFQIGHDRLTQPVIALVVS